MQRDPLRSGSSLLQHYDPSATTRQNEKPISSHPPCHPALLTLKHKHTLRWLLIRCAVESHRLSNCCLSCLTTHTKLHVVDCCHLLSSLLKQIPEEGKDRGSWLTFLQFTISCNLSLAKKTMSLPFGYPCMELVMLCWILAFGVHGQQSHSSWDYLQFRWLGKCNL